MKKASDLSEAFSSLTTWMMMTVVMTPMMTIGLCNKRTELSADNDQSDQCDDDTGNLFHWNSG